jgi:hypothetical protein
LKDGKNWVMFIQDTNHYPFKALASALGVSKSYHYAMNFVGVPRILNKCLVGVAKLGKNGEPDQTVCVEYNIIKILCKVQTSAE